MFIGLRAQPANALYRHEVSHWDGMRPMSRRLLWLTLTLGALCSIWVRRYIYNIQTDWLFVQGLAPLRFQASQWPIRLWLGEPRMFLGAIAAMWCIEDALRERASGQLDQVVLTHLSGREILEAKIASLGGWLRTPLRVFIVVQLVDVALLTVLEHLEDGRRGIAEMLAVGPRLIEQALFFLLAGALAWRQVLKRIHPIEMLRRVVIQLFALCLLVQGWFYIADYATRDFFDLLESGWLGRASYDAGPWQILTREIVFVGGLATAWLWLTDRIVERLGRRFQEMYTEGEEP